MSRKTISSVNIPPLLLVGLNPAWQKILRFREFVPGNVNRADSLAECASGKAGNAARTLKCLGIRSSLAQFVGGDIGEKICNELETNGIGHIFVSTGARTRTCTTLISERDGMVTELIEPSQKISPPDIKLLKDKILSRINKFSGIALCGTFPPGVGEDFYATIAAAARGKAAVLLDGVKGVGKTLDVGVDVLKINHDELSRLTGESELEAGAQVCFRQFRIGCLAITAGPACAHLFENSRHWKFRLPRVSGIENTIGAGDCCSGVLIARLAQLFSEKKDHREAVAGFSRIQPESVTEAFAESLGYAIASCLELLPAQVSAEKSMDILSQIDIRESS